MSEQLPPALQPPAPDTPSQQINDWLAWLDNHRLTPVAARVLAHDARVPAEARAHLNAAYAQARAQWLLRKTALQHLLALAAQEPAQPVILLKGAALTLTLYQNDPATRPMSDIDLLVAPEAIPEMLRRMRASYRERGLSTGDDVGYLHHFIFTDPDTGVQLELHKTLPLLPDPSHLAWFLQQTESHKLQNNQLLTFTPEAQLLHLISHAILEHGGEQGALGIWLYDIDQLLRKWGENINWEQVLAQAQTLKWEAALYEAIRLAQQHFATPTPPALQPWMQLPQEALSGYNTLRSMTATNRSTSRTAFHILRGLSWQQRRQQLRYMLFPSRTYMQQRYPGLPWLLTYPYRWFDAARKLLKGA